MILISASILPIFFLYGNGLEATSAKRDDLLIAFLVPFCMTIVGCYFIYGTCVDEDNEGCVCTSFIIFIIVLAVSIPVGYVYGLSFARIPDHCASMNECNSYCMKIRNDYHANLTDIQHVKFVITNKREHECGNCKCLCPSYLHVPKDGEEIQTNSMDGQLLGNKTDKCQPIDHADFGLSRTSQIVICVLSGLAGLSLCIVVVTCCCCDCCNGSDSEEKAIVGRIPRTPRIPRIPRIPRTPRIPRMPRMPRMPRTPRTPRYGSS